MNLLSDKNELGPKTLDNMADFNLNSNKKEELYLKFL